jgi:kynurenine formamidase
MKLFLDHKSYIDTSKPLDISLSLSTQVPGLRAWYVNTPIIQPVKANGFNGSVIEGGAVNFRDVFFNPHGHMTHTECLGHITASVHSINTHIKEFFCKAQLITISPQDFYNEDEDVSDKIIERSQFESITIDEEVEALVIRTLPNLPSKKTLDYSSTNPPYLSLDCMEIINRYSIKHLLIDLPSVDREEDNGKLMFHHAFWGVPDKPNYERTITELIFVENSIPDGTYILELQVAPFENDASPSRPVLYAIQE